MAQYEMNLRDYWFIIRRRRIIIVASSLLTAALSFWWAQQRVPIYQATSAVKYEQSAKLSGLLVEVLSYTSADSIETQVPLITSTPVIEEVARQLGRLPVETRGEPLRETKAYWSAIDGIKGKLRIARVPQTSILEITVTSTDGQEAKQLANTVAQVYRKFSRENRNAGITQAKALIEAQVKDLDGRVRRAEEELWAFREANRVITPGAESQVLMALYSQIRGDMERTRQQRTELDLIQQRLARVDAGSDIVLTESSNPIVQRLMQLQNDLTLERNQLALDVTERHPRLQAIDDRIREIRAEMRRQVAGQIAGLRTREEILNRQLGELMQKNRDVPTVELGLARRQRDAKYYEDQLALLKGKHQEALIKESEAVDEVSIVRPAQDPDVPISAEKLNTVLIGALLGMMLGLVLAFIQETLDTSIGTIEDVESYLEVPVLGVIPHIDPRETTQRLIERRPELAEIDAEALRNHALLITHFDPKSPVAEAYRTLRTNIQFARLERAGKILLVTSPTLQEGKTTTIVNLALTMAQAGQKTLLLGANLRRPSIYRFFGLDREPGLSDVLLGRVEWRDCIRTVADILMGRFEMEDIMASPGLDNLHIIEAGPTPANPSELLSTHAMTDVLASLRAEYDIILVDSPPVLPVTDAAIIARLVDGVVLVYQAGKIGRLVLRRAKVQLESIGGKVWGVVLNDVHTEIAGYQYTHYYTHYYGEETPTEARGGGGLRGWIGAVRSKFTPSSSADVAAPSPDTTDAVEMEAGSEAPPAEERPRRSRRSLRFWLAIGGVAVVGAGGLAALGTGLGSRGGAVEPKALLRQKLDAPGPRPPSPPAAAPSAMTPVPDSTAAATTPPTDASVRGIVASAPSRTDVTTPSSLARTDASAAAGAAAPRFAVEFGPFFLASEADRVERVLQQAGHQTVRFRQQAGGTVYAVLIERVPNAREAQALVGTLRDQGFPDPSVVGAAEPFAVRVGDPLPLRGAVQLAERLRGSGYQVRVAAEHGEAVSFIIRHGNFTSREEAEAKGQDLVRLGLPNQAVQVK